MHYTDPTALYAEIADDVELETLQIMRKCQFVGGHFVERFEKGLASYMGANHAIGISSGQDAVTLLLEVLKIGNGDYVLIPNNASIGVAFGITRAGAKPIIVDIDPFTYLIDYEKVEQLLDNNIKKSKVKAIIVHDAFGQTPNMEKFSKLARKHDVVLLEDASHAMGSTYNYQSPSFYTRAAFASLGPEMNLWSMGQAGVVITNDENISKMLRIKSNQGSEQPHQHKLLGGPNRLDSIMSAQLYHAMQKLEEWNQKRRKIARYYNEIFNSEQRPTQQPNCKHVYHNYVFCCKSEEERKRLEKSFVASEIGYGFSIPSLVSDCPLYMGLGTETPVAYNLKYRLINLPNHPSLLGTQALEVVRAVQAVL